MLQFGQALQLTQNACAAEFSNPFEVVVLQRFQGGIFTPFSQSAPLNVPISALSPQFIVGTRGTVRSMLDGDLPAIFRGRLVKILPKRLGEIAAARKAHCVSNLRYRHIGIQQQFRRLGQAIADEMIDGRLL